VIVLVCGGRWYSGRGLWQKLDEFHNGTLGPITLVVEGGARGADKIGMEWAAAAGIACITYAADWSLGPKAGPLRNQRMLDDGRPDMVVAARGGVGTADMMARARLGGVPVVEVTE
jgi:hypothetical protein